MLRHCRCALPAACLTVPGGLAAVEHLPHLQALASLPGGDCSRCIDEDYCCSCQTCALPSPHPRCTAQPHTRLSTRARPALPCPCGYSRRTDMRMLLKPMGGVTAMLHGQGTPGRLVQQRCRDHCQGVRRTNCISAVASCSSVTVHATRRRTVWLRCDALGDTRAADSAAASAAAPSRPAAAPPALPGALPAPPPAPPAVNDWYAAVGLSAIAALICSVDRAAISVAILPMSDQFGWDDTTKGAINR